MIAALLYVLTAASALPPGELAFVQEDGAGNHEIVLANLETRVTQSLGSGTGALAWSPDGKALAWETNHYPLDRKLFSPYHTRKVTLYIKVNALRLPAAVRERFLALTRHNPENIGAPSQDTDTTNVFASPSYLPQTFSNLATTSRRISSNSPLPTSVPAYA